MWPGKFLQCIKKQPITTAVIFWRKTGDMFSKPIGEPLIIKNDIINDTQETFFSEITSVIIITIIIMAHCQVNVTNQGVVQVNDRCQFQD